MKSWGLVLLLICLVCSGSEGYRILAFFPFPTLSHHNIFRGLIYELVKGGHHVTYYTPVAPIRRHPNLTIRLAPNYKEDYLKELDLIRFGQASFAGMTHMLLAASEVLADRFYGNPVAQEIISSPGEYDAVLMESYFTQEPVSALIHKFGCVAIEISTLGDSAWINEWSGLPDNPAYQVDFKVGLSDDMTVLETLYNVYSTSSTLGVSYYHLHNMKAIMDKYFRYPGWETRPPLETLLANRSLILLNTDPVLNYPYPTAPHVKNVAGMNLKRNKPLSNDLQKFMDEADNGVIYFSLGSNLNTSDFMTGKLGKVFLDVFKSLPQKILIKWEHNVDSIELPDNAKTKKWFPQNDILDHKNCILFISHAGFLSLTEAVYYGVPVVAIPFFGDQFKNAIRVQNAGYGLNLEYDNITTASLTWAIDQLINNTRYKREAEKRSQMIRGRRHTALEEAVYWVEYAIKYPNSLTPRSAFMSFWQKRIFDVGTFFLVALLVACVGLSLSVIVIYRWRTSAFIKKVKVS